MTILITSEELNNLQTSPNKDSILAAMETIFNAQQYSAIEFAVDGTVTRTFVNFDAFKARVDRR